MSELYVFHQNDPLFPLAKGFTDARARLDEIRDVLADYDVEGNPDDQLERIRDVVERES
jgi:hypothetical protein